MDVGLNPTFFPTVQCWIKSHPYECWDPISSSSFNLARLDHPLRSIAMAYLSHLAAEGTAGNTFNPTVPTCPLPCSSPLGPSQSWECSVKTIDVGFFPHVLGVGLNPTPMDVGLSPTFFPTVFGCLVMDVGLNPTFFPTVECWVKSHPYGCLG